LTACARVDSLGPKREIARIDKSLSTSNNSFSKSPHGSGIRNPRCNLQRRYVGETLLFEVLQVDSSRIPGSDCGNSTRISNARSNRQTTGRTDAQLGQSPLRTETSPASINLPAIDSKPSATSNGVQSLCPMS
jgi:hypothetical protein